MRECIIGHRTKSNVRFKFSTRAHVAPNAAHDRCKPPRIHFEQRNPPHHPQVNLFNRFAFIVGASCIVAYQTTAVDRLNIRCCGSGWMNNGNFGSRVISGNRRFRGIALAIYTRLSLAVQLLPWSLFDLLFCSVGELCRVTLSTHRKSGGASCSLVDESFISRQTARKHVDEDHKHGGYPVRQF